MNLISTADLRRRLVDVTIEHSGHDSHRDYLGMSQISRSEEDLVRMMTQADAHQISADDHCFHSLGYVFEREMIFRLDKAGVLEACAYDKDFTGEIVADFDDRFRGHIDGIYTDGSLLEIKSVYDDKLERIRRDNRLPRSNEHQIQMYLQHGGFDRCLCTLISRDKGQLWVIEVRPRRQMIDELNLKARRVLDAVDVIRRAA